MVTNDLLDCMADIAGLVDSMTHKLNSIEANGITAATAIMRNELIRVKQIALLVVDET